ncbi:hypothetical protein IA57_02490 [Mangrovimonas yunxiaonensis]|uniref:Secretion system C-terminal sorting domain-containing protein n=1 Tax=Mangrovimonas yunxiaonensis TaxID=1197477 RepID=A0A084TM26_9FLAO|nr:choice-of-anchor J domain-containing protein [Mangrovimonas yunxiaonensis]KFB01762.1 hypothetical protein IA57_02490 [Mangrovimonas yunxiaonensis]
MKKITLLLIMLTPFIFFGQTVVWSDDFNDEDISDWTLTDSDGDGFNWSAVQIIDANNVPVGTPVLRSASWSSAIGALQPDNWAISPVIDLSTASGNITLNYEVMAIDASWDMEHYTVYAATGNTINDFTSSAISFNEPNLDGVNSLSPRTLDLSSFAGQAAVYIAFRHHSVSDQFTIEIDNVSVNYTLSTEEFNAKQAFFIGCKDDIITVSNIKGEAHYRIYNILGKSVMSGNTRLESQDIHVSNLSSGIYVVEVSDPSRNITTRKKVVIN